MIKDEFAKIVPYDFHGDRLDVLPLPDGNDVGVCLRRLSEALPVDFSGQVKRLARAARKGARWAVVVKMTTTGSDGKRYTMLVLPRRSIPLWAATVSLGKVREDLRPGATEKLARYQDQCAEALADRFLGPRQAAHGQDGRAPAMPEPWPAPSLAQIRAHLSTFMDAAANAGDADGAHRAWTALGALLPERAPPPTPAPRAKAPRSPAAPISSPTATESINAQPTTGAASPTCGYALKRLRLALGLTQEDLADRCELRHFEITRVERGHNQATSYPMRAALARGADLGIEDLSAYLDGKLDLEEALRRRSAPPPGPPLRVIDGKPGVGRGRGPYGRR